MRLSPRTITPTLSNRGEINSILWQKISFSWKRNIDGVDEYIAEGCFIGLKKEMMYTRLVIMADWSHKDFKLLTGKGSKITRIDLLADLDIL